MAYLRGGLWRILRRARRVLAFFSEGLSARRIALVFFWRRSRGRPALLPAYDLRTWCRVSWLMTVKMRAMLLRVTLILLSLVAFPPLICSMLYERRVYEFPSPALQYHEASERRKKKRGEEKKRGLNARQRRVHTHRREASCLRCSSSSCSSSSLVLVRSSKVFTTRDEKRASERDEATSKRSSNRQTTRDREGRDSGEQEGRGREQRSKGAKHALSLSPLSDSLSTSLALPSLRQLDTGHKRARTHCRKITKMKIFANLIDNDPNAVRPCSLRDTTPTVPIFVVESRLEHCVFQWSKSKSS